jgi:hypothetical protein
MKANRRSRFGQERSSRPLKVYQSEPSAVRNVGSLSSMPMQGSQRNDAATAALITAAS